ncbi:MAG: NCS1 family nucleobase:cation symporter-1 [Candidatus Eisenbacteria bacterium]|uniref:NCS1 family nucleobase:cation symporter-1 n=1 Tax=Eiseniibacteriota bacterium TaxID=2212470 RepID=A0A849SQL3_UNCEI|nr:NCS1 family nucleobase:cation symporter-1 [Candidatus Eisenbacteria bacterium]
MAASDAALSNPSDQLSNSDLAPVPASKRTWNWWHFCALWIGMSVCIPTYTMASGLIDSGMSWSQAMFTIFLGNTIVLLPMLLNAHAGARYGIPFPVFARASFGVLGANVPALLRALVACGWFGIQTWFGGAALWTLTKQLWPAAASLPNVLPAWFGLTTGEALGFIVFWLINVWFIVKGTESIKWLESVSAPFLIIVGLALLGWAYTRAGGFGPILSQPSRFPDFAAFWPVFLPSLTAMVGFWATLSLNIPDFTRYARSQRDQVVGQVLGLPPTMTLYAFIGVAVTSATVIIFPGGKVIWDPVELLGRIGGPFTVILAMVALSVATLTTNLAANVVSPANDFSNLAPRRISFRTGGLITAFLGLAMMPWKLLASSQGYIFTWLIGYSALLGPIGGILIADYFVLRGRELSLDDLYRRGGRYEYRGGVNPIALIALIVGIAPCVPGFLAQAFPSTFTSVAPLWKSLYSYAWFLGFAVAGLVYLVLTSLTRGSKPAHETGVA